MCKLNLESLENDIISISSKEKSRDIVIKLISYMRARGIKFDEDQINLEDSSPYAVLNGGSSVGYRKQMALTPGSRKRTSINRIVLYCNDIDSCRIEDNMEKVDLENLRDEDRPHCYTFENSEFSRVVTLLMENEENRV